MQGQLSFDVEHVLAKLSWHIRVHIHERAESDPELVCRQADNVEHLLHAQITDILAEEVHNAGVNQVALAENLTAQDLLLSLIGLVPDFSRQSLVH